MRSQLTTAKKRQRTTNSVRFLSLLHDTSLDFIIYYTHFEITVIWLALNSLIYSRVTLFFFFFAPCHICSKSLHSCSKSRHFYFISHHFRTISHRFLSNTKWDVKALLLLNKPATTTVKYWNLYNDVNATHAVIGRCPWSIDRFQSRGQQLCKLLGIKESFNMWKSPIPTGFFGTYTWPPIHCFAHKHGRRDVMWSTDTWMKSRETCFLCFVQHGKWKPRELLSKEKRRQKKLFRTWECLNYKKSTQ